DYGYPRGSSNYWSAHLLIIRNPNALHISGIATFFSRIGDEPHGHSFNCKGLTTTPLDLGIVGSRGFANFEKFVLAKREKRIFKFRRSIPIFFRYLNLGTRTTHYNSFMGPLAVIN